MKQTPDNFYLLPLAGSNYTRGLLYTLGPAGDYQTNALVLLPYSNPQKNIPQRFFFPVLGITEIDLPTVTQRGTEIALVPRTSRERYISKVNALKKHIQRGNIYEINYCMEFFAERAQINPIEVFASLCNITRAPYCSLLKHADEYIICGSPELFLKKQGHQISTKPIKGTIKRGTSAEEDLALKENLFTSLKERTENVMAVDVARNDLSRFATKGSVQVNKLYNIETFETVHQMVSTVSCEMNPGTTFETLMDATFPMASMTGAPKISAMNLADEFEDFKRGYYSGAMGLISAEGDFELQVLIRSIFYNQKSQYLTVGVGGAITYLSEAEKEYEECLLKAAAMMRALGNV